jgi:hypothetical protein
VRTHFVDLLKVFNTPNPPVFSLLRETLQKDKTLPVKPLKRMTEHLVSIKSMLDQSPNREGIVIKINGKSPDS